MTDKNYIEKNLCTEGLDASKTKLYCSNDLEWKKLLSRNYFNKSKLKVTSIEDCLILPSKRTNTPGVMIGGVQKTNGEFIAGFKRSSSRKYYYSMESGYEVTSFERNDSQVIYGGGQVYHFGHFLLEGFSRLWFVVKNRDNPEFKDLKIVFVGIEPFAGKKSSNNFLYDCFKLLDIPKERILFIEKPTQFKNVIIPEESILSWSDFYEESRICYDYIRKNIAVSKIKKIYLSRTQLEDNKTICVNEEYFEQFYRKKGFEIISPERYSIEQQVSFISNADEIVCILGSLSHFAIFCKPNAELTVLCRTSNETLQPQILVNQLSRIKCNIVDVSLNFLPADRVAGVEYIGVSEQFKKFVYDKYGEVVLGDEDLNNPILKYLKEFCKFYSTKYIFDKYKNLSFYDILNNMSTCFFNKELPFSYSNLIPLLQDRIQILEKENARLNNIINSNNNRTFLSYRAHISNIGWVEYLTEKSNIGCCDINTKSRCNHIEAINISSSNHEFQLKYKVKIKNNGWSQFIDDGKDAGTTGKSLPLQGFVLFFDNEKYLIKYRVFWSDHTVSEWVKNGTIVESKDLDIIGMQFSVEDFNKENIELSNIKTVDILGSCISRDSFSSSFVNDYKQYFNLKTYFPRCPIPCLLTDGIGKASVLSEKYATSPWQFEVFYKYLSKNFFTYLQNNQSDALIIDFYEDAVRGVIEIDGCYFPNFKPFTKVLDTEGIKYKIVNSATLDSYFEFWCNYFDSFMLKIKEIIPNTQICVNTVKGSYKLKNGEVAFDKKEVDKLNQLWTDMDNYAVSKHNLTPISYEKQYAIDPNYPYGGSNEMVHFEQSYYRDYLEKLKEIVQLTDKKYIPVNLIKNSNFSEGTLDYWNFLNTNFELKKINDQYFCTSLAMNNEPLPQWIWIWCDPIEIFGNGIDKYELSCDYVYLEEPQSLPKSILAIREFSHAIHKRPNENIINYTLSTDEANFESNKVYHLSKVIVPRGKWLRVGIHLSSDNVKIAVSNFRLQRVI